jgi:DNA-binding response OmpR family regulator
MAIPTVLLIEDEKNIVELVKYNLEEAGFRVAVATNGQTGLERALKELPQLILLDLMLPEVDGLTVCKTLRQNEKTRPIPIIMITAKSEELDKVVGLEVGADDYMTKPFSPRELVARIKAILRRTQEKPMAKKLKTGSLEVDTEKHTVLLKGKAIELTSKEYDVLIALLEAKGRVLSREFLLEKVWGYDRSLNIETRTVDMHMGQLRKKLKSESEKLVTIKNVGYRLDQES